MNFMQVFLTLCLVVTAFGCSGWNKDKPCFCNCEDAKTVCVKNTVPEIETPFDNLIGAVKTDFCDMNMMDCMKSCIQ